MKKVNIKKNSLIVLIILILMIFLILKDNLNEILNILGKAKLEWFILGIVIYIFSILIESISLKRIINKYKDNTSLNYSFKLNMITKFFNGITPSSSGGQPFQIYMLNKEKISIANSTNIVMEFFLVYQIGLIILSIICYLLNIIFKFIEFNGFLALLFYLGLFFNTLTLILAIIVGRSKKTSKNILIFCTEILSKLRIIKDKKKITSKIEDTCNDFYLSYKELNKDKVFLLKCVLIQILAFMFRFSVSLLVFKALNLNVSMNLVECTIISIFVFLAGSYIPIPGGTGGMEYAYYGFFGKYVIGASLSSCLLLWRTISYIIPVIIGGIMFNIYANRKN